MAIIAAPRCNRRVTCDTLPSADRSECSVACNPRDPYNLIAASKRFFAPELYLFTLAPYFSFDGGQSWTEATLPLLSEWGSLSDPVVLFDSNGVAYLVGLVLLPGVLDITTAGIAIYQSTDGGRTWGAPQWIAPSAPGGVPGASHELGADKPWAAADANGGVYVVWQDIQPGQKVFIRFVRSLDGGRTWIERNPQSGDPLESPLRIRNVDLGRLPQVFVHPEGDVFVVWLDGDQGQTVRMVRSTDRGATFGDPFVVADGITPLNTSLEAIDNESVLPGSLFRVGTFPTGCATKEGTLVVAWSDYREGRSRTYYQTSDDRGATWGVQRSGYPMLDPSVASPDDTHDVFPQLAVDATGHVACAFLSHKPGLEVIFEGQRSASGETNVVLALSEDDAETFRDRVTVTDAPFDPDVDAPWSDGDPNVLFIGDYFGLAGNALGFFPMWTDTRTGMQELFVSRISVFPSSVQIARQLARGKRSVPEVVVRQQRDGDATFVTQPPLTQHTNYVYAKVACTGDLLARNVELVVTVLTNPPVDVRYPTDFYAGDWTSASGRRQLSTATGVSIGPGSTAVVGPVVWPIGAMASQPVTLLVEARCDNDDSNGSNGGRCVDNLTPGGCPFSASPSRYRNVAILTVTPQQGPSPRPPRPSPPPPRPWPWWWAPPPPNPEAVVIPFSSGHALATAGTINLLVDKGPVLADVPMTLYAGPPEAAHGCACGTAPRPSDRREWGLHRRRMGVTLDRPAGEVRPMLLVFDSPQGMRATEIRVVERHDRRRQTTTLVLPVGATRGA